MSTTRKQPPRGHLGLSHSSYWLERPDLDEALEQRIQRSLEEDARRKQEKEAEILATKEKNRQRLQRRRIQREAMEFVAGKRKSVSEEVLDFIRQGGLEKERSRRNFDGPAEADVTSLEARDTLESEELEMREFVCQLHREAMLQALEERRLRREGLEMSIRTPFALKKIREHAAEKKKSQPQDHTPDMDRMIDELNAFEDKVHKQVKKNIQMWKSQVSDVKKGRKFK
mgnify:CR=1 FL=1